MAVVETRETYTAGVLVERRALNDDGTESVYNGAGTLTSTVPSSAASQARVAAAQVNINGTIVRNQLTQALADNVATLATVNGALTIAQGLKTATVTDFATAQARIRQAGTVTEGLVNATAALLVQNSKLARLLLGQFDSTN